MNKERQKVISQLSLRSMLRTSMPAVDQHSGAPIMSSTPRRRAGVEGETEWVGDMKGRKYTRGRSRSFAPSRAGEPRVSRNGVSKGNRRASARQMPGLTKAGCVADYLRWRRVINPMPIRPASMSAYVEGSGTGPIVTR